MYGKNSLLIACLYFVQTIYRQRFMSESNLINNGSDDCSTICGGIYINNVIIYNLIGVR